MQIIQGIQQLHSSIPHPVVTIGNFDGVHLGHRDLIKLTLAKARAREGTAIVFTFRPHPQASLHPDKSPLLLNTYDEKLEILKSMGVDIVIEEPFSREFSSYAPEDFFQSILVHHLSTESLIVGYDFSFGRERQGHLSILETFCSKAGIELSVVPPLRMDGEVISSSKIRESLLKGDLRRAARFLGRPYFYRGVVIKGDGRGRKMGFPTANIRPEGKLLLPNGVYATRSIVGGHSIPSITNIGTRPTFQNPDEATHQVVVETHLIGVNIDLYGTSLEVQFIDKLRDEQKFNSMDELTRQIHADIQSAQKIINA